MTTRYVTAVRPTSGGQRVWFRCPVCGAYGDASGPVDTTEYGVGLFALIHDERCHPADSASGTSETHPT